MTKAIIILLFSLVVSNDNKIGINIPKKEEEPPTSLKKPITVETEQVSRLDMQVCDVNASFTSYMDYRMITNSKQYELQQLAITNEKGYREYNGLEMIAIHSQYGKVGDELIITFEDNTEHRFVIGDIKANTDCSHYVNDEERSLIEMIVDTDKISDRLLGKIVEYSRKVIKIEKENEK